MTRHIAYFTGLNGRARAALFFAVVAFGVLGPALAAWAQPVLQSHRAFYTFKLGKAQPGSDIASVDGVMRVAMERSCDGWVMGQDVNMVLGTNEGPGIVNRVRFAALESFDGLIYDFIVRSRTGDVVDAIRGRAVLPGRAQNGEVVFKEPFAEPITLPGETFFPVAHLIHLIERAQAGDTQVQGFSFDGTEVEGAQRAVVFIGKKRGPDPALIEKLGALADAVGWTMRIAYFKDDASDGVPEVEIELYQLENGVTPRLVLDYGLFTAEVEAQALETVAPPACS